ncbi:MAG: hypothetical protein MRJ68_17520 [Nitrospira sp.]|nr:hypothetical protein [Nitrospira sp.]
MHRVPLPQRTHLEFTDPLRELVRVARMMNAPTVPTHLDLTNCKFLSPLILCGTAALLRAEQEAGLDSVANIHCHQEGLRQYLEITGYPEGYSQSDPTYSGKRLLAEFRTKNYIPLIRFEASRPSDRDREELIQSVERLLIDQCGLDGPLLNAVKYLISEITTNITYHAGQGSGFLLAQYYRSDQHLDLAIADTGMGLRANYLASGKWRPSDDVEALRLALEGRSTKDRPDSRGFGIRTSRRMLVEGLNGQFFYWSGSAMLLNNADKENIFDLKDGTRYPGCYIAMRIPTVTDPSFNYLRFVE